MTLMDILFDVVTAQVKKSSKKVDDAHSSLVCVADKVTGFAQEMVVAVADRGDVNANPKKYLDLANDHIGIMREYDIPYLAPATRAQGLSAREFYRFYTGITLGHVDKAIWGLESDIRRLRHGHRDFVTSYQMTEKQNLLRQMVMLRGDVTCQNTYVMRRAENLVKKSEQLQEIYPKQNRKIELAKTELMLAVKLHDINKRKK